MYCLKLSVPFQLNPKILVSECLNNIRKCKTEFLENYEF